MIIKVLFPKHWQTFFHLMLQLHAHLFIFDYQNPAQM